MHHMQLSSGWHGLLFRCIVLKPGRQHVSTHGYTVMEQPVARDLFQSLVAGMMLVEPQQSSDNSLCLHPAASNTSQAGIIYHKLHKRQVLAPNSKLNFGPKNEAVLASPNETLEAAFQKLKLKIASVKRNTNGPKRISMRNAAAPKNDFPMSVPSNPFTDAHITEPCV